MNLEDDFCDIIKKSRHGQSLSIAEVSQKSQLSEHDLEKLETGSRLPNKKEVISLAQTLNLRAQPLADITLEGWLPNASPSWILEENLVTTVYGDIGGYEVKGYLLTDPQTKTSVMIDTGYNAKQMLATIRRKQLTLKAICLTHGHADHASGLDRILTKWEVPIYIGEDDVELLGWTPPEPHLTRLKKGKTISIGSLKLDCLATPGHTPGGYCYNLQIKQQALCFVGDTLFSGSVGRSCPFSLYSTHLDSVRSIILSLREDTVLLPGHGPATTVREERSHNPFA